MSPVTAAIAAVYAFVALVILAQGLLEEAVSTRVHRPHRGLGWHVLAAFAWGPGVIIVLATIAKDYMRSRKLRARYGA